MQDIVGYLKIINNLSLQELEFVIPYLTRIVMMKIKKLFNNINKTKILLK